MKKRKIVALLVVMAIVLIIATGVYADGEDHCLTCGSPDISARYNNHYEYNNCSENTANCTENTYCIIDYMGCDDPECSATWGPYNHTAQDTVHTNPLCPAY